MNKGAVSNQNPTPGVSSRKATHKRLPGSRLVSQGDTPPDTTNANSVQSFTIGQAVEAVNT